MGNQLVIPSQGNWYEEQLKKSKISVKNNIDSGTFFLTLNCVDQNSNPIIVKAYEYAEPLNNTVVTHNCKTYFNHLTEKCQAVQGIINYNQIIVNDRYAFLIRPKMQYTLSERLSEYPRLEEIEKMWVVYQIVSSTLSLHALGLVHNGLNPDNVFCDWDTRVYIGDMAPFKPTHIRKDKPNVFYHYFSTASRTGCYLAPEQIMDNQSIVEPLIFNKPSYSSDYFSIGCIIYYIFTGKDLFTFSSLIEYAEGKRSIDEELSKLPVCIRKFAANLLSKESKKRMPLDLIHETFPACFNQIFNQFLEFFTNNGSLSYFVSMIPIFNALVEEQAVEVRIILTNLFSRFILTSDDQDSIISFSFFLVEFAAPLSEEILLCRILPNIIGLLSFNSGCLVSTGLRCIVKLLESCGTINEDLENIINDYLIKEVIPLVDTTNLQVKCTMAETVPKLVLQVSRLVPRCMSSFVSVSHFIINETDTTVVNAFLSGLSQCTSGGSKFINALFPVLLSSFNCGIMMYKSKLLKIIMTFYEDGNASDKIGMRDLLSNLTQATLGFIQHETNEEMLISYLEFLDWVYTINPSDDVLIFDLFNAISSIIVIGNKAHNIIASRIIKKLPIACQDSLIPEIVIKSINKCENIISIDGDFKRKKNPATYEGDEPLIVKEKSVLNPRLKYSSRMVSQKVTGLAAVKDLILISSGHELMGLSSDTSSAKLDKSQNTIVSLSTMKNTNQVIVAYDNNTSFYDAEKMKMFDLSSNTFDYVKSVNNRVYVAAKNNEFSVWDFRTMSEKPIYKMKFDENINISDICTWHDDGILIGVGFKEGFVYSLDSRVWKPLSMDLTIPVKTIVPVCGNDNSGYVFVTSENCSSVYNISTHETIANIGYGGFGLDYLGRAILTADEGAFFIDTSNFSNSRMMHDTPLDRVLVDDRASKYKMTPMHVELEDGATPAYNVKIDHSFDHYNLPLLHGHSSHITAFTHWKNFVTGDEQGFVNIWSL